MICLSIGHHAKAKGASTVYNGKTYNEYDIASDWCDFIAAMEEDNIVLVPPGNLRSKVAWINHAQPMLAAELHFNDATDGAGKQIGSGFETLYYPGSTKGKAFAETIQEHLGETLETKNRGAREGYYRMNPSNGPDFFLARTKCPAVIIEPAFIREMELIQRTRKTTCMALAGALVAALSDLQ